MKKKITAALLCAIMTLSLAGCSENEQNVSTPNSSNSESSGKGESFSSESVNSTEESKPEDGSFDSKPEDSTSTESNTESKPVTSTVDWSTVPVADEKDFEYTVYEAEEINYSVLKEEVREEVEKELKDGFAAISEYHGQAEYINLPEQIEGKNHIFVSSNMDWGSKVKAIKFSDGFSSIRSSYLRVEGCLFTWGLGNAANVTELTIPDNWEYVGGFSGMPRLKSFNMPGKAHEIWDSAFKGCVALESVEIPEGVIHLGESSPGGNNGSVFADCVSLAKVSLPSTLEDIYSGTFSNCTSLKSIDIPDSVTKIENGAFDGCTGISINYKGKTYNEKDIANLYDKDLSTM